MNMWLVTDRLIDWQDGWPVVDWVNDLLNCLLIDSLTEFCFIDLLAACLADWVAHYCLSYGWPDWLTGWLTVLTFGDWLTKWLTCCWLSQWFLDCNSRDWLTDYLTCFSDRLAGGLDDWVADYCLTYWSPEWLTDWLAYLLTDWPIALLTDWLTC